MRRGSSRRAHCHHWRPVGSAQVRRAFGTWINGTGTPCVCQCGTFTFVRSKAAAWGAPARMPVSGWRRAWSHWWVQALTFAALTALLQLLDPHMAWAMAARFWVGGTGNWDATTTTHWSATTGGAGGASVPTSADTVTFDANSGATATVTITAAANPSSLTINKSDITLTQSAGLTVVNTLSLTQGTWNSNGQAVSMNSFASNNSFARTLTLGASNITVTGGGSTAWNLTTSTNLVVTTNTATVTFNGPGQTMLGSVDYKGMSVSFTGSGAASLSGTNTFKNLTRTGTAVKTDSFTPANQTVTGTLTLTGNSTINRLLVQSVTLASQITLTAAAVSLTNVDFADVKGAGVAAPFTGTSLGDTGGNATITFTAATTQTWQGTSGGSWSTLANWTSRIPLPQDTVRIASAFAASQTITLDMPRLGGSIDFTGTTGSPAVTTQTATGSSIFYGSLTLAAGVGTITLASSAPLAYRGRGSGTLTSAGRTFSGTAVFTAGGITTAGVTATLTLQDDFNITSTNGLLHSGGTLDANGHNVAAKLFSAGSVGWPDCTLNMGSGTWTINGTGTVWNIGTILPVTVNASTSTLAITDTSATSKTLTCSAKTYNNLTITGGGTGAVIIQNFNTWNVITIGAPKTVQFQAFTTNTFAQLIATGSAGNVISIQSDTSTSQATLSCPNLVALDFVSLRDLAASGTTPFYAGANSTNVSNNTNWSFTGLVTPSVTGGSTTAATDQKGAAGAVAISGAAATTAAGQKAAQAAVSISRAASTTASTEKSAASTVADSSAASAAVTGGKVSASAVAVSAAASTAAAGTKQAVASHLNLWPSGSLWLSGDLWPATGVGASPVSAAASAADTGRKAASGAAVVSGAASAVATGHQVTQHFVVVAAAASTAAAGRKVATGAAAVSAATGLGASASRAEFGTGHVGAGAEIGSTGVKGARGALGITGGGAGGATGEGVFAFGTDGLVTVGGGGALASGFKSQTGISRVSGGVSSTAAGSAARFDYCALTGAGSIRAVGFKAAAGTVSVTGGGDTAAASVPNLIYPLSVRVRYKTSVRLADNTTTVRIERPARVLVQV